MRVHNRPAIVILFLLLAGLACSLTREDLSPTAVPTPDTGATLDAVLAGTPQNENINPPELNIQRISPPSPIDYGQTISISVVATHDTAVRAILYEFAIMESEEQDESRLSFQQLAIHNFSLDEPQTEVSDVIEWEPADVGLYMMRVASLAGQSTLSEARTFRIRIQSPVAGTGNGEGSSNGGTNSRGPCEITSSENSTAIRADSDPSSRVLGNLRQGQTAIATQLGRDASWQGWYFIEIDGTSGWVIGTEIDQQGGCAPGELPVVQ